MLGSWVGGLVGTYGSYGSSHPSPQDYDGSSSVSPDARMKIASVHAMLRAKISEVRK